MKNLFFLLCISVALSASYYSPMVKQGSNTKIIDIGERNQASINESVSKVWAQYEATFNLIGGIIQTKSRIYSDEEVCITDEFNRKACPINSQECSDTAEYTNGSSSRVDKSFITSTFCPVGSTYNTERERCEAPPECTSAEYTYEPETNKCTPINNEPVFNDYSKYYSAGFFGYTYLCESGDLYQVWLQTKTLIQTDFEGSVINGLDIESCFIPQPDLPDTNQAVCPRQTPNLDETLNICHTPTICSVDEKICKTGMVVNYETMRCESNLQCDWPYSRDESLGGCYQTIQNFDNYEKLQTISYSTTTWSYDINTKCENGDLYIMNFFNTIWTLASQNHTGGTPKEYNYRNINSSFDSCYKIDITEQPDGGSCPLYTTKSGIQCIDYSTTFYDDPYASKVSETQCEQPYSYYQYSCPDEENEFGQNYESPATVGSDCFGLCPTGRADNCFCNDELPPTNNCARISYECPLDATMPCVHNSSEATQSKPLEYHEAIGGELSGEAYGTKVSSPCGEGCDNGIRDISGDESYLCFTKGNSQTGCLKVDGCTFSGRINSSTANLSSIFTNGHTISAIDTNGVTYNDAIESSCVLNGSVGYEGRNEPIGSYVKDYDKIKFWGPYSSEGYLGFIEFVREVADVDEVDGYVVNEDHPWNVMDAGFNRLETVGDENIAISTVEMTDSQCAQAASEFGYEVHPGFSGVPTGDTASFELIMNATGGYFNSNTLYETYTEPSSCRAGFIYDSVRNVCSKTTNASIAFDDSTCTDEKVKFLLQDDGSGKAKIVVSNHAPNGGLGHNCSYSYKTIESGFLLPAGATNVSGLLEASFTYSATGSGCTASSGTVAANTYVGRCGNSGAQTLSLVGTLDMTFEQTEVPFCQNTKGVISPGICTIPIVSNKRCVIRKFSQTPLDFQVATHAIKNVDSNDSFFFCSPLTCGADNSCQLASCPDGLDGTVISPNRPDPGPQDCLEQDCDANLPFYEWCGKESGCPKGVQGYTEIGQSCYETVCSEGGFDPITGACYKWQCPDGTHEDGDRCVKN